MRYLLMMMVLIGCTSSARPAGSSEPDVAPAAEGRGSSSGRVLAEQVAAIDDRGDDGRPDDPGLVEQVPPQAAPAEPAGQAGAQAEDEPEPIDDAGPECTPLLVQSRDECAGICRGSCAGDCSHKAMIDGSLLCDGACQGQCQGQCYFPCPPQ